jgi:hypothetical protein
LDAAAPGHDWQSFSANAENGIISEKELDNRKETPVRDAWRISKQC